MFHQREGKRVGLRETRKKDIYGAREILRTLGFFFLDFIFYNLIPKRRVLDLTLVLILVPKLRHFGISLKKKKKRQHYNFKP